MLQDLIPAQHRKIVYGLAALAALAISAYKAAHGDWIEFSESLLGGFIAALAHSNTNGADE